MQTKSFISIVVLIFIISFINPINSLAQREPKNKILDDRIKTRFPINDQTKPRERPGEKEKIKEKNPNPPIKEKKPPDEHWYQPPEYPPIDGICIAPKIISYPIDGDMYVPEPEITKPNYKLDGITKYEDGDYWKALDDFNIAIEEDSNDYELFYHRGLVEMKIKFFEEAKEDFSRYLIYVFYEPEGYFQRGLAKFYLSEKEEAKEDFQIAADMGHKMAMSILKRFY
ncbi:MAG: hypothetical protein A2V93_02855 [Ignavibacteria bacterium RBG_16_34_14]|nr:MAG: hypothetical protein A2V93_02855 [Ignavibacteria bacterium RBG_16_34_14]